MWVVLGYSPTVLYYYFSKTLLFEVIMKEMRQRFTYYEEKIRALGSWGLWYQNYSTPKMVVYSSNMKGPNNGVTGAGVRPTPVGNLNIVLLARN